MKDLAARMMAPAAKTCLMNMIMRNMEKELQEKMSDSDDETTGDRDMLATAQGRAKCHWAGFRHGMTH